ncbi:MAG: hypothetical protein HY824_13590 [Acidobacteria bacterium]|nr:hypothetical protein [Acidobacteriota bacterium]
MAHCPKCHSQDLRRSRTRNRWERWRRDITGKRPYRCRACEWRGWLPIGSADNEQPSARLRRGGDPPNLRGTLLARPDASLDLDLKELDRFHTTGNKDKS